MASDTPSNPDFNLEYAGKAAGPCVFVLFGAAGDLTKRKLVPALFNLVKAKLLPDNFVVMGVSVDDLTPDAFRDQVSEAVRSLYRSSKAIQGLEGPLEHGLLRRLRDCHGDLQHRRLFRPRPP